MKKAAIISLYYGSNNYGGIAQSYALNKSVQDMGWQSEMISYQKPQQKPEGLKTQLRRDGIFRTLGAKLESLPQKTYFRSRNKSAEKKYKAELKDRLEQRKQAFSESRDMVPHTRVVTEDNIAELRDEYDVFISGSDQIWKPGTVQPAYVLSFLDEGKKRFSYASSITANDPPKEYGDFMKEALERYEWISVRENNGKSYLQELLNRDVDVVVDPTLLLSTDEWNEVAADRIVNEDYMFVYLLGASFKQRRIITEIAHSKGLKIVTLPHVEGRIKAADVGFGDICLYDVGLAQFLSLIKHAAYVCTDSYHAVIFSNIFETDYSVFERYVYSKKHNMNSRLNTLLPILCEEDRYAGRYGETLITTPVDFVLAKSKLQPEVERSKALLRKALG